jgi:hypothetical protein
VAHACNSSYSGGRDQEDGGWKPAQAKSYRGTISINKLGMVACICNLGYGRSYVGGSSMRLSLGKNRSPYLKIMKA